MKVRITVRGRTYTVRSDESDVDLEAVAAYVDRKMEEVGGRGSALDDYTVAMLAAMNIASDLARLRREVEKELESLDRDLASTAVLLEAALPAEP